MAARNTPTILRFRSNFKTAHVFLFRTLFINIVDDLTIGFLLLLVVVFFIIFFLLYLKWQSSGKNILFEVRETNHYKLPRVIN